jgi:hypothetical protein
VDPNGEVRAWLAGHQDLFEVFDANGSDDEGAGHPHQAMGLVERDADGRAVGTLNLASAFPRTSACTVTTEGGFVNMSMVVTDNLEGNGPAVTVGFTFHFNTTSHGGKFDLDVASWPWSAGADHTLAFGFALDAPGWTAEPASDGVGFRDANGTAHGYVSWAPNATARYADGHEEQAVVNGTVDAQGGHADVALAFTNATAGYDELICDPGLGSGDCVVVAGPLVGLGPSRTRCPARSAAPCAACLEPAREVLPLALAPLRRDLRRRAADLPRAALRLRAARVAHDLHLARDRELHLELAGLRAVDLAADLLDLEPAQRAVHRAALAPLGLHLRAHLLERGADRVADARARRADALDHLVDGHRARRAACAQALSRTIPGRARGA